MQRAMLRITRLALTLAAVAAFVVELGAGHKFGFGI